jgi:hypothetical protein
MCRSVTCADATTVFNQGTSTKPEAPRFRRLLIANCKLAIFLLVACSLLLGAVSFAAAGAPAGPAAAAGPPAAAPKPPAWAKARAQDDFANASAPVTTWSVTPAQSGVNAIGGQPAATAGPPPALAMPSLLPRVSQQLAGSSAGAGIAAEGGGATVGGAAAGTTQVLETANQYFAVYDKASGAIAKGFPKNLSALFAPVSGCNTATLWNPTVLFDQLAQRWLITAAVSNKQLAVSNSAAPPSSLCVALSQSDDATGTWNVYEYTNPPTASFYFDSPRVALWTDAYSLTYNVWQAGTSSAIFEGVAICGIDRNALLSTSSTSSTLSTVSAPAEVCTRVDHSYDANLIPVSLEGANYPPAGANPLFFETAQGMSGPGTYSNLYLYRAAFDFTAQTVTLDPAVSISVQSYSPIACAPTQNCHPERSEGPAVGSCSAASCAPPPARAGYRVVNQNGGGDYESVVLSMPAAGGLRWWELRAELSGATDSRGSIALYQEGTYPPDVLDGSSPAASSAVNALSQDHMGNLLPGYIDPDDCTSWYLAGTATLAREGGSTGLQPGEPEHAIAGALAPATRIQRFNSKACSDAASITLPVPGSALPRADGREPTAFLWTPGSGHPCRLHPAGRQRAGKERLLRAADLRGGHVSCDARLHSGERGNSVGAADYAVCISQEPPATHVPGLPIRHGSFAERSIPFSGESK